MLRPVGNVQHRCRLGAVSVLGGLLPAERAEMLGWVRDWGRPSWVLAPCSLVVAVPSQSFVMFGLPLSLGKARMAAEALRGRDLTHRHCRGTVRSSWYGVMGAVVWCCSSSASSAWALLSPRITYRPSRSWSRTKCRQRSLPLTREGMGIAARRGPSSSAPLSDRAVSLTCRKGQSRWCSH